MAVSEYELTRMAGEEMDLARRMSWTEMTRVTPWSDTYVAVSTAGPEVEIERCYAWADEGRQAIQIEVKARALYEPDIEVVERAKITPKGFE